MISSITYQEVKQGYINSITALVNGINTFSSTQPDWEDAQILNGQTQDIKYYIERDRIQDALEMAKHVHIEMQSIKGFPESIITQAEIIRSITISWSKQRNLLIK